MKISVVIPFYNLERYVRPCLDSVAAAIAKAPAGLEIEVICIDDGSTDGTGRLLDSERRLPLRVIHQANAGEGSARNAGMAAATGEWITFLDGDDVWLENHLAVAVPTLNRHPDADLVSFGFASFVDGERQPNPTGDDSGERMFDVRGEIPSPVLLDVGVYPTFFHRGFIAGAAFTRLPLGADRLFVAQCLARAKEVMMGPAVIHGYRLRANSMAHCAWGARKVMSQCDYAFGSLRELAASGKVLGREGHAYLASLWLSDVPNRLLRLKASERAEAVAHWIGTLNDASAVKTLPRFDCARRLLRTSARIAPRLAVRFAWILRKGGLT